MALLRRIAQALVQDLVHQEVLELGIYVISGEEMVRLNETFLRHSGSTDVITFNYNEPSDRGYLHGEIFVCLDEAQTQARRFGTTWQSELVRYIVHGTLHLMGYDDQRKAQRVRMEQLENRFLKELAGRFPLGRLANHSRKRDRRERKRIQFVGRAFAS